MTSPFNTPAERAAIDTFRQTVHDWLDVHGNLPTDIPVPQRGRPLPAKLKEWTVEFRRKLGAQGWLAPNWPQQYGGGGLSPQHGAIIQQELGQKRLPPLHGSTMALMALRVYGTEEQKSTYMASVLQGEATLAHMLTEADRGTDLRSIATHAPKEGDHYVINGQKDFVTSELTPDLLLCFAVTDRDATGDDRLSMIIIDAASEGVLIRPANLLTPGAEQTVYMTDVRSPLTNLLGKEGQGLEISNMMLEIERGGIGVPLEKQREIEWQEKQSRENIQN